jgi:arsenate reductase
MPDPVKVTGTQAEIAAAFDETYRLLAARIALLVSLPMDKLDRAAIHRHVHDISRSGSSPAPSAA